MMSENENKPAVNLTNKAAAILTALREDQDKIDAEYTAAEIADMSGLDPESEVFGPLFELVDKRIVDHIVSPSGLRSVSHYKLNANPPSGGVVATASLKSDMFFVQHLRTFSGDSIIWWRANRSGYTFRIDEAGQYTQEEARSIERLRGQEKAFPVDMVLSAASRHVVADDLYKATEAVTVTS